MASTHPRAQQIVRSELFNQIRSFGDLEKRIRDFGQRSSQDAGDSFEIFVEAYLATRPQFQIKNIWHNNAIPLAVRKKLRLPSRTALGTDGVFENQIGDFVPYQVKFRTGQKVLSFNEVAPFLGITDNATDRIIITNCHEVAFEAKSRKAIRTIRYFDFETLVAEDFEQIEAWLKHKVPKRNPAVPKSHQDEAIAKICSEFEIADRATAVMASGTGKTFVALWVAEALIERTLHLRRKRGLFKAQRILVLVPSLSLIQQTLYEWAKAHSWGERFRFLCVCSDKTVTTNDELQLDQSDVEFPITTTPDEIQDFFRRTAGCVQVVFSTYQSSKMVGKACEDVDSFDLAIFDEAHKTTGSTGKFFAFALHENNIRIKKRLFLTATPRHYDISKRNKEGDFRVVSMDDESVYGRVAYRLSFREAARSGIICDFKVVISVINSKDVSRFALDRGITLVEGDEVQARWVANQIALKKAVAETGATKIITFHSRVNYAKRFSGNEADGICSFLKDFTVNHVNGQQKTSQRKEWLMQFRKAAKGLVTNARCLTEGVDLPAVDMVAFIDPKKSKVDIAQATGRAMRKPADSGKTLGYIVVPLYVQLTDNETVEDAVEHSDFMEVATVLNALKDQDDDLVDIIREIQEQRGEKGRLSWRRLSQKVQVLGPRIGLEQLRQSVLVQILEKLGTAWDLRYGELVAYKELHGDCNVPARWKENPQLASWVGHQREIYASGELSSDRIKRLEKIGFQWNRRTAKSEERWVERFAELVDYKKQHGDCNVPHEWKENPQLAAWVKTQRVFYARRKLSSDRIKRLKKIGFQFDFYTAQWEERFVELVAYKKKYGHCNVPAICKENPQLGRWVSNQRTAHTSGKLSSDQIKRLKKIGFQWALKQRSR